MNQYYYGETDLDKTVPLPAVIEILNIIHQFAENPDNDTADWVEERTHRNIERLYNTLMGEFKMEDLEHAFKELGELLGIKHSDRYQAKLNDKKEWETCSCEKCRELISDLPSQYPIEDAQYCLNNQKPNIHYAVFRMWTGDEHIEELTASSYDEAEDLAHSLANPDVEFVCFLDEYIKDKISSINKDISRNYQLLQLVEEGI